MLSSNDMYQITVSDTFAKVIHCFEYQILDTFGLDMIKIIISPHFLNKARGSQWPRIKHLGPESNHSFFLYFGSGHLDIGFYEHFKP